MRSMTAKEMSILNSLVTYAAENVPGGLNPDEREVAKIVGTWALTAHEEIPLEAKLEEIYMGMTEEQKSVLHFMIGLAIAREQDRISAEIDRRLLRLVKP